MISRTEKAPVIQRSFQSPHYRPPPPPPPGGSVLLKMDEMQHSSQHLSVT